MGSGARNQPKREKKSEPLANQRQEQGRAKNETAEAKATEAPQVKGEAPASKE